jgi:Zn-dependent protease
MHVPIFVVKNFALMNNAENWPVYSFNSQFSIVLQKLMIHFSVFNLHPFLKLKYTGIMRQLCSLCVCAHLPSKFLKKLIWYIMMTMFRDACKFQSVKINQINKIILVFTEEDVSTVKGIFY